MPVTSKDMTGKTLVARTAPPARAPDLIPAMILVAGDLGPALPRAELTTLPRGAVEAAALGKRIHRRRWRCYRR
jgi:hypothetical protein